MSSSSTPSSLCRVNRVQLIKVIPRLRTQEEGRAILAQLGEGRVIPALEKLEFVDEDRKLDAGGFGQRALFFHRDRDKREQRRSQEPRGILTHHALIQIDEQNLFLGDDLGEVDGRAWLPEDSPGDVALKLRDFGEDGVNAL